MTTHSRPRFLRVMAVACIVTLACFTLTACESIPKHQQFVEAEQHWSRLRSQMKVRLADQQLNTGRVTEAVVTLEEASRLDPDNPALHRMMARCHLEQRDARSAVDAINRALAVGDQSADLAYTQGLVAEHQWRHDDAVEHHTRAAALDPRNVDYVVAIAECRTAIRQPEEARALLDASMKRFNRDPKLLLARAGICTLLGDLEQAARDYGELNLTLGNTPWTAERHGLILLSLRRYKEALATLEPLVNRDGLLANHSDDPQPPAPAVIRAVASCYNGLNRPAAAESILNGHLRDHPDDARAWWLLAEAAVMRADATAARECLTKGRRLAPGLPHWDTLHAYLAWNSGDAHTAGSILESAIVRNPNDAMAHCFLGEILQQNDQPDRARGHFELALAVDPDCAWALFRTQPNAAFSPPTAPATPDRSPIPQH